MTSELVSPSLNLTKRKHLVVFAWVALALPVISGAATPRRGVAENAKLPAYDVVSIKINKSGSGNVDTTTRPSSYSATNVSLKDLLQSAFDVKENLIFGGPGWVNSARFDVEAKIVDPDLDLLRKLRPEQIRLLLRPILAERFKTEVHSETRVLPIYEILVAKGGPKFKEVAPGDASNQEVGTHIQNSVLTAHAIALASLASTLSNLLHRTVIDRTGLSGKFDLAMSWTPEYGPDASPEASAASLITALGDQLGLKLRSAKGPVEVLVIDHVEMPSEN